MELLAWVVIPGSVLIFAYGITKILSYGDSDKDTERDIDRYNYLSAFLNSIPDSKKDSWASHFAEQHEIRCRLKRRGIEV